MSLLWRGRSGDRTIEVRRAGGTRRLCVGGVLHTSWNPSRPLTGAVWDHMALSAFLAAPGSVRRVLLLGVGGGAVVHLLRRHVRPTAIVAVERDAVVLDAARRWFDLAGSDLELVADDARSWLDANGRERFDLVIDDLFGEAGGLPVRDAEFGADWWPRLSRLVAPGGVLVVNFAESRDLTSSPVCQDVGLRYAFPAAFRFSTPRYWNAVTALCRRPVDPREFRARSRAVPSLRSADARRSARFVVHRLWPRHETPRDRH